jgi:hypothetical protein
MDRAWTTVSVGEEKVSVRTFEKGEETSKEVDTPERPFISSPALVLQLARPQPGSEFALPIFHGSEGTVASRLYKVTDASDGRIDIEVVDEDGKPAGNYRLRADGSLDSFKEKGAAWVMERTTKEEVLAFHQSWMSRLSPGAQPDSQSTPGTEP